MKRSVAFALTIAMSLAIFPPISVRAENEIQAEAHPVSLRGWTVANLRTGQPMGAAAADDKTTPEIVRFDYQSPQHADLLLTPPAPISLPDDIRDLTLWFARVEGDFTLAFQIRDATGATHEIKTNASRMRDPGMVGWQPERVREWSMWTQARSFRLNVPTTMSGRVLPEFENAVNAKIWKRPLTLLGIVIKPAATPAFDAAALGGDKTRAAVKSGNGALVVAELTAHTKDKLEAARSWHFYGRSRTGREIPPALFLDDMTGWAFGEVFYEVVVHRGYQGEVVWRGHGKGFADRKNPASLFTSKIDLPIGCLDGRYFVNTKAWRPDGTLLEERQFLQLFVTQNQTPAPTPGTSGTPATFQIHSGVDAHVFPSETQRATLRISLPDQGKDTPGNAVTADAVRIKILDFYSRVVLQKNLSLPAAASSPSLEVTLPVKAGDEFFADAELRDEKTGRRLDHAVLHFGVASPPEPDRGDVPQSVPDRDTVLGNGQFHHSTESWDGDRTSQSFPWVAWGASQKNVADFERFCQQAVRAGVKSINLNDVWGSHEMLPGVYQWQELDRLIERATAHGLKVFLAYTVGTRRSRFDFPLWLNSAPRVDQAGNVEGLDRGLYWPSWWDAEMREGWLRFYRRLVGHVRANPNVIGYRLSNYQLSGYTAGWGADPMRMEYSAPAQREFARWSANIGSVDDGSESGGGGTVAPKMPPLFYVPGTLENQLSGPDLSPDWQAFTAFATYSQNTRLADFFATIRSLDKRRQIQVDQKPFPWAIEAGIPLLRDGGVLKNEDSPTFGAAILRSMCEQAGVPYAEEFHAHFPTSRSIADATNFWHSYLSGHIFWMSRWETFRIISSVEAEKKGGWGNLKLTGEMTPEPMLDYVREMQPAWERWLRATQTEPQVLVFGSRAAELLGSWRTGQEYNIAGAREFTSLFQTHQIPVHFANEHTPWSRLENFKVVLVCGEVMTSAAIDRVVAHVRGGGKIVIVGNAGNYCPERPDERNILETALEKTNVGTGVDAGAKIRRIAQPRLRVEKGIPEWQAAFGFDDTALNAIFEWAGVERRVSVASEDTSAHGGAGARFECQSRTSADGDVLVAVMRKWPGWYLNIAREEIALEKYGLAAARVNVRGLKDGAWRVEKFHREKKAIGVFEAVNGVLVFDVEPMSAGEAALYSISPAQADGQTDASLAGYVNLDGQVIALGNSLNEKNWVSEVSTPCLQLMRSAKAPSRGTIILMPGGGYGHLEMDSEGVRTARWFNEQGFDAAILEYRVNAGANTRNLALADSVKAWRLLSENGKRFGLSQTRIGLMGYSAGGHLAARTAQELGQNPGARQPDDLVLIYPAWLNERPSSGKEPFVLPPASPATRLFTLIAVNDRPEWVASAKEFSERWKAAGGEAFFHLLPTGWHGFGMAEHRIPATRNWQDFLQQFLSN